MTALARDGALSLTSVSYQYPASTRGVEAITLRVPAGTVYGLVGANGAGKTTVMRLMAGLLEPRSGEVSVFGLDAKRDRTRMMQGTGTLIETPSLYEHLSATEHLRVFAEYTGAPGASIARMLQLVGLHDARDQRIGGYSLGMKQRLGLATALLHDPALLVLDEPTNGLDPMGIVDMRRLIIDLARQGKTIVVSSHLLGEVEKIADRIGVIDSGRMKFDGSLGELADAAMCGAAGETMGTCDHSLERHFFALVGGNGDAR